MDREAGVEHVAAGHPLVQPAPFGAKLLARPSEEGDDVMLGDVLDLVDGGYVDLPEHVVVIGLADGRGIVGRDHPDLAHRLGREHLDLPPDSVAVLG